MRGARLQIRELRSPAEFAEASQAAKAAWGFPDLMVPPPPDMITATHSGGMTAGAFEGRRLLGFVHAVPRTNLGRPTIHSHLLAVRPDAQRRGLSVLLKLYQRQWCLARGIGLVTWTYDPFMLRNARLNLVRLGAVVPVFLPDFYGKVGGIYGELPSDRFEVHWKLESPAVERAARGETSELTPEEVATLPVVRSGQPGRRKESAGEMEMGSVPFSVITKNGTDPISPISPPSARRILLPFPAGFPEAFRDDLAAGVAARRRFGRAAAALFAEGFEAVSVVETPRGPAYLLERC